MTLTQQPTHIRRARPRVVAATLTAAVALAALSACAGSGDSSATSAGSDSAARAAVGSAEPAGGSAESRPADGPQAAPDGLAGDGADTTSAGISIAALQQRRQVRTGQVSVQVRDVEAAVSSARSFATAAQGFVQDEKTSSRPVEVAPDAPRADRPRPTSPNAVPSVVIDQSVLTLRVPQQVLDDVMRQVGGLGAVRSRSQSSQDVTDSYVDTASRVKSQQASVERVRTLLGRASGIGDVVRLESELSRREADLDALKARLASLDDSTTLATLVVTLSRPDVDVPAPAGDDGFLAGLQAGWHALGASATVVLQIVGALIPFAVLLTLLGLPAWLVLRRRRAGSPAPSA